MIEFLVPGITVRKTAEKGFIVYLAGSFRHVYTGDINQSISNSHHVNILHPCLARENLISINVCIVDIENLCPSIITF
jgi:hypothetical protein